MSQNPHILKVCADVEDLGCSVTPRPWTQVWCGFLIWHGPICRCSSLFRSDLGDTSFQEWVRDSFDVFSACLYKSTYHFDILKINSFRAPSGETSQKYYQHRPQFSSINGEILWPWPGLFIWICDGWTFSPDHSDSYTLKELFAVVSFNAVSSPGEIEQPAFLQPTLIYVYIFFALYNPNIPVGNVEGLHMQAKSVGSGLLNQSVQMLFNEFTPENKVTVVTSRICCL